MAQFFVRPAKGPIGTHTDPPIPMLSCHLYMRSCDLFLGLPFNMSAYALLTNLLAFRAGIGCEDLIISFGDAHIYSNHIEQVKEQLARPVGYFPGLHLDEKIKTLPDLRDLTIDMIDVFGYQPLPALKGEVAV